MSSNLERLTQQSVINWIENTAVHGVTVGVTPRHFETDNTNPVTLPIIIIKATREREEIVGSGVCRMRVEVGLIAQADDTTDATLSNQWSNFFDVLNWDELAARMSDLSGFYCYGVIRGEPSDKQTIERHWQFRYDFTAFCMPMDYYNSSSSSSSSSST